MLLGVLETLHKERRKNSPFAHEENPFACEKTQAGQAREAKESEREKEYTKSVLEATNII